MNFVVSFAISLFSGVLEEAAEEFGCGKDTMALALTLYILGLAFGRSCQRCHLEDHTLTFPQDHSYSALHRSTMAARLHWLSAWLDL